jgi:hypothetical protein
MGEALRALVTKSSNGPGEKLKLPTREEVENERFACGCPVWSVTRGCLNEHRCCVCKDNGPCSVCSSPGKPRQEPDISGVLQIPPLYRGARLDNWQAPPDECPLEVAKLYAETWPPAKPFLAFLSEVKGNGKTRLACSILFEVWFRHHVQGQFWPVVDILNKYKASYSQHSAVTTEQLDYSLRHVPVLVIDDLGAQKDTAWADEQLYNLINDRYNELRPTIITANVLGDQLDERIRSRMNDHRLAAVELLEGPDRRPEQR